MQMKLLAYTLLLLTCAKLARSDIIWTQATVVNQTTLQCPVPVQSSSFSRIEVSPNYNISQTMSHQFIQYFDRPRIHNLSVSLGPIAGGTLVTIFGVNFGKNPHCKIGSKIVSGLFLSHNAVKFFTPPYQTSATVTVEISNNGVEFTKDNLEFFYYDAPTLLYARPDLIPLRSGVPITVFGTGFFDSNIVCRISTAFAAGIFINSTAIKCDSKWNFHHLPTLIAVSLNGLDYSENLPVSLNEVPSLRIDAVYPSILISRGYTLLRLIGVGFIADSTTSCVFDGIYHVPIQNANSTYIECRSVPKAVANASYTQIQIVTGYNFASSNVISLLCLRTPQVTSVIPSLGPITGSTIVVVKGLNFFQSDNVSVKFGSRIVAGIVVNSTTLICSSPSGLPGAVNVSVSLNKVDYSDTNGTFQFYPTSYVNSVSPAFGSSIGGTPITVAGVGFIQSSLLSCRFGLQSSPAIFLNSSLIICVTPRLPNPLQNASVNISVSNNAADFSNTGHSFEYRYKCPEISVVGPHWLPSSSNSSIFLRSTGFRLDGVGFRCMFRSEVVPAELVNNTIMSCSLPSLITVNEPVSVAASENAWDFRYANEDLTFFKSPELFKTFPEYASVDGTTDVLVFGNGFLRQRSIICRFNSSISVDAVWISGSVIRCPTPAFESMVTGSILMDVSLNGGWHFTSKKLTIHLEKSPFISSLMPFEGTGSLFITVSGSGFRSSPSARCKFGNLQAGLRYINSTNVICRIPYVLNGPITVQVSNNGVDFSNAVVFNYQPSSSVYSVFPSFLPKSCPNRAVLVTGRDFVYGKTKCVFNLTSWQSATFINRTQILCSVPNQFSLGVIFIATSENGYQTSVQQVKVELVPDLLLDSRLSVNFGPTTGNTIVTISGANFHKRMLCKFGESAAVQAEVIDFFHAVCISPPYTNITVALELSNNGRDYTDLGIPFSYYTPPTIQSVSPAIGSISGRTLISVVGTNFFKSNRLACQFGVSRTFAQFVNSTLVQCRSPPSMNYTVVPFSLTLNGHDSSNTLPFSYEPLPSLTYISPNSVSTELSNRVMVNVTGSHFLNNPLLSCYVDRVWIKATFLSSNLALCPIPSSVRSTPKTVLLRVSNNYADLSSTAMQLVISKPPSVRKIWSPASVPFSKTVSLTIFGKNFMNSRYLSCRFSHQNALVAGIFLDTRTVLCDVPPAPPTFVNISVWVTNNLIEFSSPVVLKLHPNTVIRTILPTYVAIAQHFTVIGDNFVQSNWTSCIFNSSVVAVATFLNSSTLVCFVPRNVLPGPLSVSIRNGYGEWSESSAVVTVISRPAISKVSPSSGSHAGGTMLTLSGTGFVNHSPRCFFNDSSGTLTFVDAIFVSSNRVTCNTPSGAAGLARIDVSLYNVTYTPMDWIPFQFTPDPYLQSIFPDPLPEPGGWLTIIGSGFYSSSYLKVNLGQNALSPVFISQQQLQVQTPLFVSGNITVSVSNNGQEVSNSLFLSIRSSFNVTTFFPQILSTADPTTVYVVGNGFYNSSRALCKFGAQISSAIVMNSSYAYCISPLALEGSVRLGFGLEGEGSVTYLAKNASFVSIPLLLDIVPKSCPSNGSSVYIKGLGFRRDLISLIRIGEGSESFTLTPVFINSTTIHLEIPQCSFVHGRRKSQIYVGDPLNHERFSGSELSLTIYENARIDKISPSFGFTSGNTAVVMVGYNFHNLDHMTVLIANHSVVPIFISSNKIVFHAPPFENAGTVYVYFSQNGQDFIDQSLEYRYIDPPVVMKSELPHVYEQAKSTLTILGGGFLNLISPKCQLNNILLEAVYTNSTQMICNVPGLDNGNYSVSIIMGNSYFLTSLELIVISRPVLLDVKIVDNPDSFTVNITGSFYKLYQPFCRLGNEIVKSSQWSPRHVVCNFYNVTSGTLRINIDDRLPFQSYQLSTFVEILPRPYISSISPSAVAITGNDTVLVSGAYFINAPNLSCLFGKSAVKAHYVNASAIQCRSVGASFSENISIRISNDGASYSSNTVALSQAGQWPDIFSFYPQWTFQSGGQIVTISGRHFTEYSKVFCIIGASTSEAKFFNSSALTCVTPILPSLESQVFRITSSLNSNVSFVGNMTVYQNPVIDRIHPDYGLVTGGNLITVFGNGFLPNISVRFGHTPGNTTLISSNLLVCLTPPRNASATVTIQLMFANFCIFTSDITFQYLDVPFIFTTTPLLSGSASANSNTYLLTGQHFTSRAVQCIYYNATEIFLNNAISLSDTELICLGLPQPIMFSSLAIGLIDQQHGIICSSNIVSVPVPPVIAVEELLHLPITALSSNPASLEFHGSNFQPYGSVYCLFNGRFVVESSASNATVVICDIPLLQFSSSALSVEFFDNFHFSEIFTINVSKPPEIESLSIDSIANISTAFISVHGQFDLSSELVCHFDSIPVAPTSISSTEIECPVPSNLSLGPQSVGVSISFFERPKTSLPLVVFFSDQTTEIRAYVQKEFILFVGKKIYNSPDLVCVFDNSYSTIELQAIWLNDSLALCPLPDPLHNTKFASLCHGKEDPASHPVPVTLPIPQRSSIYDVVPSIIDASRAFSLFSILGSGFDSPVMTIVADDFILSAKSNSSTLLSFIAPVLSSSARPFQIRTAGFAYFSNPLEVFVKSQPRIFTVFPNICGLSFGITTVTIIGSGFDSGIAFMLGTSVLTNVSITDASSATAVINPDNFGVGIYSLSASESGVNSFSVKFSFVNLTLETVYPNAISSSAISHESLTISGSPFLIQNNNDLFCVFDSGASVYARVISNYTLVCRFPDLQEIRGSNISLQVGLLVDKQIRTLSFNKLWIEILSELQVTGVALLWQDSFKLYYIVVNGYFDSVVSNRALSSCKCRSNFLWESPATVLNVTTIQCFAPSQLDAFKSASISVSCSQQHVTLSTSFFKLNFDYGSAVRIALNTPTPIIGAKIEFSAFNVFRPIIVSACRFALVESDVSVVTQASCTNFSCSCLVPDSLFESRLIFEVSPYELSNIFIAFNQSIRFLKPPSLNESLFEREQLLIQGRNFSNTVTTKCIYQDGSSESADYINSTAIVCPLKALSPSPMWLSVIESNPVVYTLPPKQSLLTPTSLKTKFSSDNITFSFFGTSLLGREVVCLIEDSMPITASIVNNTAGFCKIPSLLKSFLFATVFVNGERGPGYTTTIIYDQDPYITRLQPDIVQVNKSLNIFSVIGGRFKITSSCFIGGQSIQTINVSENLIFCAYANAISDNGGTISIRNANRIPFSQISFVAAALPKVVNISIQKSDTVTISSESSLFPTRALICKLNGSPWGQGIVLSSFLALCKLPQSKALAFAPQILSLSVDGGLSSVQLSLSSEAIPPASPIPISLYPNIASAGIQTRFIVRISPFNNTFASSVQCKFGDIAYIASWLNSTAVDCGLISVLATCSVTVIFDYHLVSDSALSVTVPQKTSILSLSPRIVTAPFSRIFVEGTGFGSSTLCRFDTNNSFIVAASFISNTAITCSLPWSVYFRNRKISVEVSDATGRFLAGPDYVQLLSDVPKINYTIPASFTVDRVPFRLNVFGSNFFPSSQSVCILACSNISTRFRGTVISQNHLICIVASFKCRSTSVSLSVSNDLGLSSSRPIVLSLSFNPSVQSVLPDNGLRFQDKLLTIRGTGFSNGSLCFFNRSVPSSNTVFVSSTALICQLTSKLFAKQTSFSVSTSPILSSASSSLFVISEQPEIFSIDPQRAVIAPQSPYIITLLGRYFQSSTTFTANNIPIPKTAVTFLNSTAVLIVLSSSIRASNQFVPIGIYPQIANSLTIEAIPPVRLLKVNSFFTSSLNVLLSVFPNVSLHGSLNCIFSAAKLFVGRSVATIVNSSCVECYLPPASDASLYLAVSLEFNGASYSNSVNISVLKESFVKNIRFSESGNSISIIGSGFLSGSAITCKISRPSIAALLLQATIVNYGVATCVLSNTSGFDTGAIHLDVLAGSTTLYSGILPLPLRPSNINYVSPPILFRNVPSIIAVNFQFVAPKYCLFNQTKTKFFVSSFQSGYCVSPASGIPISAFRLTDQSLTTLFYTDLVIVPLPKVNSYFLTSPQCASNNRIIFVGSGFSSGLDSFCFLSSKSNRNHKLQTSAIVLNSTHVECSVPSCDVTMHFSIQLQISNSNIFNTTIIRTFTDITRTLQVSTAMQTVIESVTVCGASFSPNLLCEWSGSKILDAILINSTFLKCPIYPVSVGNISLRVLNPDFTLFTAKKLSYQTNSLPTLVDIFPTMIPLQGGTILTISGYDAKSSSLAFCYFYKRLSAPPFANTILSSASNSSFTCVAPSASAGSGFLVLSPYLRPFGLRFYPEVVLLSLSPTDATFLQYIVVHGINFIESESLVCSFNGYLVPSVFLSSSAIRCQIPLNVQWRSVAISVSNNGVNFSNSLQLNIVTQMATLLSVYPSRLPNFLDAMLPTVITVIGSGFPVSQSKLSFCMIEQDIIPATVHNSTMLTCAAVDSLSPFNVLRVSTDNQQTFCPQTFVLKRFSTSLRRIWPASGSSIARTIVRLSGSGFYPGMLCYFGSSFGGICSLISSIDCWCYSPMHSPGSTSIFLVDQQTNITIGYLANSFVYKDEILITSAVPSIPIPGDMLVLSAVGLSPESSKTFCKFGFSFFTLANLLSKTSLACQVPDLVPGNISVQIVQGVTSSSAIYVSLGTPSIEILTASPLWGPLAGGTPINLTFFATDNSMSLSSCQFSSSTSVESYLVEEHISEGISSLFCFSPPYRSQFRVQLRVILNNQYGERRPYQNTFYFNYVDINVQDIRPSVVDSDARREFQLSTEYVFEASDSVSCVFNLQNKLTFVTGNVNPDNSVTCNFSGSGVSQVGLVGLQESRNALSAGLSEINFLSRPVIANIYPLVGLVSSHQTIFIEGLNLSMGMNSSCRFQSFDTMFDVPARPVSQTLVTCGRPDMPAGNYPISFSSDGIAFKSTNFTLTIDEAFRLDSVFPKHGPMSGGTILTVNGFRFPNRTSLICRFSNSFSVPFFAPAIFISSSMLKCVTPKYPLLDGSAVESVEFNIFFPGTEPLTGALEFLFTKPPIVHSVSPSIFYSNFFGADITIRGLDLYPLPKTAFPLSTLCRFNTSIITNATYISNSIIVCPLPASMLPGSYRLSLSQNEQNFIDVNRLIWFWDAPIIQSIQPVLGPMSGGTPVYLRLSNPLDIHTNTAIVCEFGSSKQLAPFTLRNSTNGFCISPQVGSPGFVRVSLYILQLGQHFSQPPVLFEYHLPISAFNVLPNLGDFQQPTAVFIRGPNVFRRDLTKCIVTENQMILFTMFISTELVICTIPAGYTFPLALQSYGIHISLTNAPSLKLLFKFHINCPIGRICFKGLQFACPSGTFCSNDRRNGNFSLCLPGEYQSYSGQSRCFSCPLGYICPDYGTRTPFPCPSGHVCQTSGAIAPSTLCPPGYTCSQNTIAINSKNLSQQVGTLQLQLLGRFRFPLVSQSLNITSNMPAPCSNGSFCLGGSNIGNELPCDLGADCLSGEYRPEGKGIPAGYFSPSSYSITRLACPNGHYCPSLGNAVPVSCPRGTYSDVSGMSFCKICPIGFICPFPAMVAPIRCAPGLLCMNGLPDELQECPSGFFCQGGIAAPCSPGTYCLSGVESDTIALWNFSYAQACMAGSWCQEESSDAYGSGFCPPGTYCPTGTFLPLLSAPGQFVSKSGMFRSLSCPPGRFSPNSDVQSCSICPSGYTCPFYGMVRPLVCPRGYYRTQDEGINCEPCPPGTWSDVLGLPDQSQCSPCPSGKVCGIVGMFSLDQASKCVEGYVCDQATYPSIQFDIRCPEGYACPAETTLSSMFQFLCPPGYICIEGTPYSLRNLYRCPPNRYCPRGTYRRIAPAFNSSEPGVHRFVQLPGHSNDSRPGDLDTVWDQFWTVCQDKNGGEGGDPNEPCGFFTVQTPLPDGTVNIRYSQVCPIGTQSSEKSVHIDDCTVIPGYGPATKFSPVDLRRVDELIKVEVVGVVDYWFINVEPLDLVLVDLDYSNIPTNITYLVHWQLSLFTDRACRFRRRMPITFESASTAKAGHQQLTIAIREQTSFTWRLEILHGISLWSAMSFVNTTSLHIRRPSRALLGTRDTFMAVVSLDIPLELPLNLRRSDEMDLSVSYTTELSDSTSPITANSSNSTADVFNLTPDSFSDVFVSRSEADNFYAEPFMPFISNCIGFDSYIHFFQMFESENCSLVDEEDTQPVNAINFGQSPVSDVCYNVYQCEYEEILSSVSIYNRWYMATNPTLTFYITSSPVSYNDILKGPEFITNWLTDQIGNDYMIPVMASSLDPNSDSTQVPRIVRFVIEYQQVDKRKKKIITASLYFDQFDPDRYTSNYTYQFEAVLKPLGYSDLVNRFAFPFEVYFVLFIAIGAALCAGVVVYWSIHKLLSRVRFRSRFQLWQFLKISESKPLIAIGLFSGPILITVGLLYLVLVEFDFFGGISGKFEGEDQITIARARVYRGGRLAVCFITLGIYQVYLGSLLFIPKKVRRVRSFAADDHKQEQYEAAVHEATQHVYRDRSWMPRIWKRLHFMSSCLLICIIMVFLIEFSYSDAFSNYTIEIILLLKVLAPAITFFFESLVQEKLLTAPFMTTFGATTFVMTMGAPDLTGFVTGFVTDSISDVVDTVYAGPANDFIREKLQNFIDYAIKSINSAVKRRAARLERERRLKLGYAVKDELEKTDEPDIQESGEQEEIEEVIEPVIESFNEHATAMIGFVFCPLILVLFILFRQELQIPITYNIRENDMHYYLLFSVVLLPFLIVFYAFLVNVMEVFHGFKTFSYLKYCEFKFLTRTMRWQACESNMDMGIDPALRSIHQFSFSSQYSFTTVVTTMGMILVVIGIQAMIRQSYNMFADPITPVMITISMIIGVGITQICKSLSDIFGLWRIKNRFQTLEAQAATKRIEVTDWEQIEHMAAVAKIQLQEDMKRIETPRLIEEAFRSDFIRFNRTWLVTHLQEIVSPRNVRRDRSRALAQLGRVLLTTRSPQEEIVADQISSDSSSGDDFAEQLKAFKYAKVNAIAQKTGSGWLAIARWRLRLRDLYAGITHQWLQDRSSKCNRCDSTDNVLVASDPSLDHLVNRYHHMDEITTPESIVQSRWKNYLDARAEFTAICKRCLEEQDELKDALTKFSGSTRKLATIWLQIVRQTLKKRKQEAALLDQTRSLSDDEESDNTLEETVRQAAKDVNVSEISEQIYQQWLNFVRLKIIAESKRSSDTAKTSSLALETIEESSSESDYEFAELDAGNKNIVGPVSDLTDQMIQFWIDDARLALYCQHYRENAIRNTDN